MRTRIFALALAALPALALSAATPALAQSREDEDRFQAASRRFDNEVAAFQRERDRYTAARSRGAYRDDSRYGGPAPGYGDRDPYATDYDASRYYRDDPRYQERRLGAQDEVYRGSDGRYYCRRSDGTTGLIIGAGAGALLGNAIDGGRRRTAARSSRTSRTFAAASVAARKLGQMMILPGARPAGRTAAPPLRAHQFPGRNRPVRPQWQIIWLAIRRSRPMGNDPME